MLSFYDLGTPGRVRQAAHGYVNETAFAETSCGCFVVRRNHLRLGEAAHRYRHRLIARLRERDFPAPALIPARDGATLLMLDGRFYEVYAYVGGEDYDPGRPRQLSNIGATLARYHHAVECFPPPAQPAPPRYSPQDLMAPIERLLERDVMAELLDPLAWYGARVAYLRAALPEAAYEALPHLVIHGDIHSDNLRFAGDEVSALLDYDQATWDARIVDLADALVAFASVPAPGPQSWGVYRGPLDESLAATLLATYAGVFPLTTVEIALLPVLVEVLWLRGELGRVLSTPEGAPDYHQAVLDQGCRLSEWIAARRDCLIARWSDLGAPLEGAVTLRFAEPIKRR